MLRKFASAALLLTGLLGSSAALAVVIPFNATRTNERTAPVADGVCAPRLTLQFDPGSPTFNRGTSNLGDFAATISECIDGTPPAPNSDSPWRFEFANGAIFGTKFGNPTGPVPGGASFQSFFSILGGTGFFRGASGEFNGVGTVVFARSPAAIETLTGFIDVPEPAAFGLLGSAVLGLAALQRRRGSGEP